MSNPFDGNQLREMMISKLCRITDGNNRVLEDQFGNMTDALLFVTYNQTIKSEIALAIVKVLS